MRTVILTGYKIMLFLNRGDVHASQLEQMKESVGRDQHMNKVELITFQIDVRTKKGQF